MTEHPHNDSDDQQQGQGPAGESQPASRPTEEAAQAAPQAAATPGAPATDSEPGSSDGAEGGDRTGTEDGQTQGTAQGDSAEATRSAEAAEAGRDQKAPPEAKPRQDGDRKNGQGDAAPLVCVRYGRMGMLGLFRSKHQGVPPRTRVVIKSDRGLELGTALCGADRTTCYEGKPLKRVGSIRRTATHDDLMEERHLRQSEDREREFCHRRIKERGLPMTLAAVEHLFGGDRIVFYFLAEGRVDFRDLVKDLAHEYQTRVEMRQIGVRDQARLVADYERCGQFVCCRTFIKEFQPVSMRMAKLQKATLDPSKISGRCGRLMCCLRYEFDTYEELRKRLPKKNTYVMTEVGPGKVVGSDILTQLCKVSSGGKVRIVPIEEITGRDLTEEQVANWRPTLSQGSRPQQPGSGRSRRGRRNRKDRSTETRADAESPAATRRAETPRADAGPGDQPRGGSERGEPSQGPSRRPRRRRRKKRSSPGTPGASQGQGDQHRQQQQRQQKPQPQQESRQTPPAPDQKPPTDRGMGVPRKVLESLGVEDSQPEDTPSARDEAQRDPAPEGQQEKRRQSHRGRRRSKRKKTARGRDGSAPREGPSGT